MFRSLIVCFFLFVTLAFGTIVPNAGIAQRRNPSGTNDRPIYAESRFSFDLFSAKGVTPDSTRTDLYVAVPYSSLQFEYAVDKYVANYSVSLQVSDNTRLLIDRYEMYTVLETTDEHKARTMSDHASHVGRADAEQLSLMLSPDIKYSIHLAIRDFDSHIEVDTSFEFVAKDYHGAGPSMSDLMVYRERHGMRVVPSIGPDVSSIGQFSTLSNTSSSQTGTIVPVSGLFTELYNLPADSTLGIVTEIFHREGKDAGDDSQVVQRATSIIRIEHSNVTSRTAPASIAETPFFESISFDELWIGRYTLRTYILPSVSDTSLADPVMLEKRALTYDARKIIVSSAHGIPITSSDLDQAIEQLRLIASGDEWESLSRPTTVREKRQAILDFWRNKMRDKSFNPNPGRNDRSYESINRPMQVFYSRIEYANARYGTGFQAGWKTDRGRVYIAIGDPEFIDSHPYETMQKPYEIWEYSTLHAKYYFVDQYMMGDFRLAGMPPAPGTFVWDR